jgi:maltooligosyltrehalose trehalohydrolase
MNRRFAIGAEVHGESTSFRVWAPKRRRVEVVLQSGASTELEREESGYFAGVAEARAGDRYCFRLDGGDSYPDPVSRFQAEGPHGASQIVDPAAFAWSDGAWRGVELDGQVIYEMHIGTFTQEGTWESARRELAELAAAGITTVEVMPVADFPGRFGWGYDGVGLFAPVAIYGTPDDFRRFVDEAHRVRLGVLLDVVYNHVGPDGN